MSFVYLYSSKNSCLFLDTNANKVFTDQLGVLKCKSKLISETILNEYKCKPYCKIILAKRGDSINSIYITYKDKTICFNIRKYGDKCYFTVKDLFSEDIQAWMPSSYPNKRGFGFCNIGGIKSDYFDSIDLKIFCSKFVPASYIYENRIENYKYYKIDVSNIPKEYLEGNDDCEFYVLYFDKFMDTIKEFILHVDISLNGVTNSIDFMIDNTLIVDFRCFVGNFVSPMKE